MEPGLSGKRALIYGGATGIGYACAEAMLKNGAKVFITGRRKAKLESASNTLSDYGALGFAAGDFTEESDVARVTEAAATFLGGIDSLVVSSGRSGIGSILDCSLGEFEEIITVNLTGPFLAARAAAPHLVAAAPSSVVLIASVVGTAAMKERVAYCTSKAGILGMTRAVALDLADKGVRVNAISPSLVLTELARDILSRERDPAAALAHRKAQHPVGRLGRPEEIGAAAVYLASDASAWVTGQNLIIDGGLSVR
ncbi:MAG: SDR family oxidoreductase [Alphaproteobacteria bacterium]|nr:SDR family oxidoreductase [Alphaproteobacteria bacterium]